MQSERDDGDRNLGEQERQIDKRGSRRWGGERYKKSVDGTKAQERISRDRAGNDSEKERRRLASGRRLSRSHLASVGGGGVGKIPPARHDTHGTVSVGPKGGGVGDDGEGGRGMVRRFPMQQISIIVASSLSPFAVSPFGSPRPFDDRLQPIRES